MTKKKLQLVPHRSKLEISDSSPEEEACALYLADVALHNPTAARNPCPTSSRAGARQRLIEELERENGKTPTVETSGDCTSPTKRMS
jgi:hypothetical protein